MFTATPEAAVNSHYTSQGWVRINEETPDGVLVCALLSDSTAAWREFNRRYSRLMFRSIARVLQRFTRVSDDDCHEVYSSLCVQLLAHDKKKLRTYDDARGAKLGTWLTLLANHAAYDHLRRCRREPTTEDITVMHGLTVQGASPFDNCALKQEAQRVSHVFEDLSEKDREFMVLYYAEGLEPEQVALEMGISVKTVYSKKHKIRSRLAGILAEHEAA
jgi:RNA polymerase sigma-70 factor, ECF subfamily